MPTLIEQMARALRIGSTAGRPWYTDLCDYYHVTPDQALELGTRAKDRRPNLPGSSTTHPISGKTFEELWAIRKRETPAEIYAFYEEIGAWSAFRQVVFHRDHSFRYIDRMVKPGFRICEYGAGAAPVCFWLIERLRGVPLHLTIVDVPSEHLRFGLWRLQRRITELGSPVSVEARHVQPGQLPLTESYDMMTMLEVYEHLHNPLEVTRHVCEHVKPGGLYWENYILHDHPTAADLPVSQGEREQVFQYLRAHCQLIKEHDPRAPHGGSTRCWRRQ